jgi:general secretion pathway protein F
MKVCESLGTAIDPDGRLGSARAAIERGIPPSQAFAAASLVDDVGERLLRVGERGGQFEQVLRTLAARHSERFTLFMQRATRLVEPLLLTIVAVLVGGTVVMMYMPVFDAASGIQ